MWSFLIPLVSIAAAAAQNAPRDARLMQNPTAVISGIVLTDDADPKPVRHARVVLTGGESTGDLTAIADGAGRFVFEGLRPGRFSVTASKDGWIPSSYGAKKPLASGTAVPIAEGQHADITIRLWRAAAISGTVLDHTGQPAVGTTVRAMRSTVQNGERRLTGGR